MPGFAFRYRQNSAWWDRILIGKTGHIITTLDQSSLYYRFVFGRPSVNHLKKTVLRFCGIKPIRVTYIQPIKNSKIESTTSWLKKVEKLGQDSL